MMGGCTVGVEGDQGWDSRKGGCLCQKRSGEDKYHDPWSKGQARPLIGDQRSNEIRGKDLGAWSGRDWRAGFRSKGRNKQ